MVHTAYAVPPTLKNQVKNQQNIYLIASYKISKFSKKTALAYQF